MDIARVIEALRIVVTALADASEVVDSDVAQDGEAFPYQTELEFGRAVLAEYDRDSR